MRRLLLATAILAAPLFAQQYHNGSKAWEVSRLSTIAAGPSEVFAVFRGSHVEIVPLKSLMRVDNEVVISTRFAAQTLLVMGAQTIALVTHGDADFHQACLDELFIGPVPSAIANLATELVTYYVGTDSALHKIITVRAPKQSVASHVREHQEYLKEMWRVFPMDKQKTLDWEMAKAPNAAVASGTGK